MCAAVRLPNVTDMKRTGVRVALSIKMRNDFKCPSCFQVFKNPMLLPCGHNLCLLCVETENSIAQMKGTDGLVCPVCQICSVLRDSAYGLPKNLLLRDLIDSGMGELKEQVCCLCKKDPLPATYECVQCEIVVCAHCGQGHQQSSRFARHTLIPLGVANGLVCLEHTREMELFCLDDKQLCCFKCANFTARHRNHIVVTKEAAQEKISVEECKRRLNEVLETISSAKTEFIRILGVARKNRYNLEEITMLIEKYDIVLSRITKEITSENNKSLIIQKCYRYQDLNPFILIETLQQKLSNDTNNREGRLVFLSRGTKSFLIHNRELNKVQHKKVTQDLIPRWSGFTLLTDNTILVTGGKHTKESGALFSAFSLNVGTASLIPVKDMLAGHSSHSALRVNAQVFCLSGKNSVNLTHTVCEYFDLQSLTWNLIAPLNKPRTCAPGANIGDFIYVLGGHDTFVTNSIEKYSISANVWTDIEVTLPERIWQHGACPISDSEILVFGGEGPNDQSHGLSFIYNVHSDAFYGAVKLPVDSVWLFFWLDCMRYNGEISMLNREEAILRYSISGNTWSL